MARSAAALTVAALRCPPTPALGRLASLLCLGLRLSTKPPGATVFFFAPPPPVFFVILALRRLREQWVLSPTHVPRG
jgi:hypothetical protein